MYNLRSNEVGVGDGSGPSNEFDNRLDDGTLPSMDFENGSCIQVGDNAQRGLIIQRRSKKFFVAPRRSL